MHVWIVDAEGGELSRCAGGRRVRVLVLRVIASERTMGCSGSMVVVGWDVLSARDLSATVREGSVFLNFSWYF